MRPLLTFGNAIDVKIGNEETVIDNYCDHAFYMVREGDAFTIPTPKNNLEKVDYYFMRCSRSRNTFMQKFIDPLI